MSMSPRLLRPRASGGFTPKTISGLGIWLDATDTSSLTFNGDTVSEWRDISGNARHFAQASAALQPNAVTNTINNKRSLTFTAGDMQSATGKGIARNVAGITLFAVVRKTNVNDGIFWYASRNGSNSQFRCGFQVISGSWQVGGRRLDADSFDGVTYSATNRLGPAVFANVYDYGNAKAFGYFNGSLLATDDPFHAAGNTSDTDSDQVSIGANVSSSVLGGSIGEIIVYRRALTATERVTVERYLGAKWGVTVA
jgi:hypothetical protein